VLATSVSKAMRVSLAARERGLDLRGTAFFGASEPPTPAKVREIVASGAHWMPEYGTMDSGSIGLPCGRPQDGNDTHFTRDTLALIPYPRRVPGSEVIVSSFHFTGLLPAFPKIMLNAESDDFGRIEPSTCGCPLEQIGLTEHLREVAGFRKLSGEGMTLVGSEMVRILEEVLPARFGGSPLDYQLLEEEDEQGFTRLNLLVHPRVRIVDDGEVIDVLLEALRHSSMSANVAQAIWSQAGSFRIQRRAPILTGNGKLLPLSLARRLGGGALGARPS
jgi:hypothetical protein